MAHTNEAYQVLNVVEANITPYTHFSNELDREMVVGAAVAGEHILFTGTPGGGKTTIAKAIASSLDLSFARFQGDPMSTTKHVIGSRIYNAATSEIDFHEGPIFSDIFLADEFNRNSGQTQAAVIEAMQEGQVTPPLMETRSLSDNFLVIATQNKQDKTDGINLLTQANQDRFSLSVDLSKPYNENDLRIVSAAADKWEDGAPSPVVGSVELAIAKNALKTIRRTADADRLRHAQWLVMSVREHPLVDRRETILDMARPALKLMRMAAISAAHRDSAILEEVDINRTARYVLGHRIEPTLKAMKDGYTSQSLVDEIIAEHQLPTTD
jgi:MoxR-like ATPase